MSLDKILSIDSIVNRCEQVLQKKLSDKSLKLEIVSQDNTKTIVSISSGTGAIQFADEEITHKEVIVPFVQAHNQELYWLGFSIVFKKVSKSHFTLFHLGTQVYQGQISNQEKRKIFRAEWMVDKNDSHAQPHWHVHKSFRDSFENKRSATFNEKEVVLEFGAETSEEMESNKIKDQLKSFHFAMASRWHKKEHHNNELKDLNEVVLWLEGCLDYIIHQLNYIS